MVSTTLWQCSNPISEATKIDRSREIAIVVVIEAGTEIENTIASAAEKRIVISQREEQLENDPVRKLHREMVILFQHQNKLKRALT